MKRPVVTLLIAAMLVVAVRSGPVWADGEVTAKAFDPDKRIVVNNGIYVGRGSFQKAPKGIGTVNPNATIATSSGSAYKLKMAIDSAKADAKSPDLIRLDFTGKGVFKDSPVVPMKKQTRSGGFSGRFGPVTLVVEVDGRKIPVTVRGQYQRWGKNQRYLNLRMSTCLVAKVKFGDKLLDVSIADGNSNLICSDRVTAIKQGKGFRAGSGDGVYIGKAKAHYGQPIQVDGVWYDVTLTPDAKRIVASKSTAETTTLTVLGMARSWHGDFVGKKYILRLNGTDAPMDVPADEYAITSFNGSLPLTGESRTYGHISLASRDSRSGMAKKITLLPGKTFELKVGQPLNARIDATVQGRKVTMKYHITDVAGMGVDSLSGAFRGNPLAKVEVYDAAGKLFYSGTFEYS